MDEEEIKSGAREFREKKRQEEPESIFTQTLTENHPEDELLEILKDPNLFNKITIEELNKKIVGEIEARQTIFLVQNMRNVENLSKATDNLMLNAFSGTGKDHISEAIFEILHKDEKEELIRTSPKALAYTRNQTIEPEATWKKTTLRLEDVDNAVLNDTAFKVLSSANPNKINTSKVVVKNKSVEFKIEGKPSIILTIADPNPKEETLRRFPICNLDEGRDQTKEILKRQAEYSKLGKSIEYNPDITNALKELKRVKVRIPYADNLVQLFCPENVIVRTHFPRFLDYIKSSCSLHQYQREVDNEDYYIATGQDYDIGRIALMKTTSNILMIPLTKLRKDILKTFENLNLQRQSVEDLEDLNEIKKLNITDKWLRVQLDWLTSKGFLLKDKEKRLDESGRTIPKPIFIYSYNPIARLEIPTWKELNKINSIATTKEITTNSSHTIDCGVNEVNELIELNSKELNLDNSEDDDKIEIIKL